MFILREFSGSTPTFVLVMSTDECKNDCCHTSCVVCYNLHGGVGWTVEVVMLPDKLGYRPAGGNGRIVRILFISQCDLACSVSCDMTTFVWKHKWVQINC